MRKEEKMIEVNGVMHWIKGESTVMHPILAIHGGRRASMDSRAYRGCRAV
ncbi:hypothetical protein [Peribacillus kribbensis]|nr:hypothetical protein [Peribacillus kribbensis]